MEASLVSSGVSALQRAGHLPVRERRDLRMIGSEGALLLYLL
jgi:hypothetical protein